MALDVIADESHQSLTSNLAQRLCGDRVTGVRDTEARQDPGTPSEQDGGGITVVIEPFHQNIHPTSEKPSFERRVLGGRKVLLRRGTLMSCSSPREARTGRLELFLCVCVFVSPPQQSGSRSHLPFYLSKEEEDLNSRFVKVGNAVKIMIMYCVCCFSVEKLLHQCCFRRVSP